MTPLAEVGAALQEAGHEILLQPGHADRPDQLFVAFTIDALPTPLHLQLLYLPDTQDPALLQFFVQIATEVEDDGNLGRFVHVLNPHLPVPGFELSEARKLLYYRHVRVCPGDDLDGAVTTALMVIYLVGRFAPLLQEAVRGRSLDDSLRALDADVA